MAEMIKESETAVRIQGQPEEVRICQTINNQVILTGRVSLIEQELAQLRRETGLEIAKSEEERDNLWNERFLDQLF